MILILYGIDRENNSASFDIQIVIFLSYFGFIIWKIRRGCLVQILTKTETLSQFFEHKGPLKDVKLSSSPRKTEKRSLSYLVWAKWAFIPPRDLDLWSLTPIQG